MLPRPSWPRAVQSGLWQNRLCGSIGVPREAGFGDHAWRDAGWTRVFQVLTPESRFNGVLPVLSPSSLFPTRSGLAVLVHDDPADREAQAPDLLPQAVPRDPQDFGRAHLIAVRVPQHQGDEVPLAE